MMIINNEISLMKMLWNKIYVKKVRELLFVRKRFENDKRGKFVNKREECLSIVIKDDIENGKRFAIVMMRNTRRNVLREGILNEQFNKFVSFEKKFKYIVNFYSW